MKMRYDGRERTVRHGPRVLKLAPGELEVHPSDVALLVELGAVPLDDDGPGDTPAGTLEDLTVDELRDRAAAAEIPGRSSMTKAELVDALTAAGNPQE